MIILRLYDWVFSPDAGRSGRMSRLCSGVMPMIRYVVSVAIVAGAVFVSAFWSDPALADKRVALVIGNSNYRNVPKLPNPSADASAIAEQLKNAGFDSVDLEIDVENLDFKRAIRKFEHIASDVDIAVIFFAGHGIELRGTNYMIPVDAKLADDRDAPDEAITLDRLVEAVEGAKRLRLVIVDACRDNPFNAAVTHQTGLQTVTRGLARIEPYSGTLVAYATKPGSTAEDGHGPHSPLTTALLDNLTEPGLDIRLAFGRVSDEVLKITDNRQEPFVYGSLGGQIISLVPAPSQPKEAPQSAIKTDYELVVQVGTKRAYEIFLSQYPTGFYSDLARAQLAKLNAAEDGSNKATNLELPAPPAPAPAKSDEVDAWNKIKDSEDQGALQKFIKRYPNSPLVLNARRRLSELQQITKEREAQKAGRNKSPKSAQSRPVKQQARQQGERRPQAHQEVSASPRSEGPPVSPPSRFGMTGFKVNSATISTYGVGF